MILEVRSGAQAGKKITIESGKPLTVGRSSPADIVFADDVHMSGRHCLVEFDNAVCRVSDLNSRNGTAVNGRRVDSATLSEGNTITAGQTVLQVHFETALAKHADAAALKTAALHGRLLAFLREDAQPLFAILDAARDPQIYALLLQHGPEFQSLYEGKSAADLLQLAPYLLRLPPNSPFLELLVRNGWGNSWGVYLTSDRSLAELRHHLRHFLEVLLPGPKQVYFRFYDPRVLRVYLPTCTTDEVRAFFGPIRNYLFEAETPKDLLSFSPTQRGITKKIIPLETLEKENASRQAAMPATP